MEALLELAFDNRKFDSFPSNIENFHKHISFIVETFWKSHGNKVILLPSKALAIENLKIKISTGDNTNIAYRDYFNELIINTIFDIVKPPVGYLSGIYNKIFYMPPFLYDFDEYNSKSFSIYFSKWLNQGQTEENWLMLIGTIPTPTLYFGLTNIM